MLIIFFMLYYFMFGDFVQLCHCCLPALCTVNVQCYITVRNNGKICCITDYK